MHIFSHGVGNANNQFQIGANARAVRSLFDQLQIAERIGDGTGLFIQGLLSATPRRPTLPSPS